MSCPNCQSSNSSVSVFDIQYIYNSNCTDCNTACNGNVVDSKCVGYYGPNLVCSTISTNDSLELVIQKIDEVLCSTAGDYSSYNIHCLVGPITTEAQFVSAITEYACAINESLDNFKNVTFVNYQEDVDDRLDDLEIPAITCANSSVTSTDSLQAVLNKYCTKLSQISANISTEDVDWDQCFTVTTPPNTVHEGFDLLIDQICQVKALVEDGGDGALPVFNNIGSCLASPSSADTLVDTIGKIKTRLCQTGTFSAGSVTWGCVTSGSDLQTAIQNTVNRVSALSAKATIFDTGDFSVEAVDPDDPCAGVSISLASSLNSDKHVASTSTDDDPGTLEDKLEEGDNITLDYTTTPGKVIISSDGGASDGKVKANTADPTADYLDEKLEGGSDGPISIGTSYDTINHKVVIQPNFDMENLVTSIRSYLETNPTEKAAWCQMFADCPSPCSQPQNVSVVYVSAGVTTTTTTTPKWLILYITYSSLP